MNEDYEIKIRLLNGVSDSVQSFYKGSDETEGSELIVHLIELYTADIKRRLENRIESIDYLFHHLKKGIRLAGELIELIQHSEAESLSGWFYGCEPKNLVQRFMSLFWEVALYMTQSVLEIEAEWPALKPYFDWERQNYALKCEKTHF